MKQISPLAKVRAKYARTKQRVMLSPLTARIFAMEFIAEFELIGPFYAIMFGDRSGVSAVGLGIILATWQITTVLAEVPTGVIADKMSKKWALFISRILRGAAFCAWLFMPHFTGYLIGAVLWGISDAFSSGALQAYLYESLPSGQKKSFGKIYARINAIAMLSYTVAYLVAFAIGPNYNLLLGLCILTAVVSAIICLTLPNTKPQYDVELKTKIVRTAVQHIRKLPALKHLFIGAVVIQALTITLIELISVYYLQVGAPLGVVPLLLAINALLSTILFWTLHHFDERLIKHRVRVIILATLFLVSSFFMGTIGAIIGIMLFVRVIRLVVVSNESAMQHLSHDQARATIGSLYSFAAKLLAAGSMVTVGWLATTDNIVWPVRWLTIILVVLFVIALLRATSQQKQSA